MAIRKFSEQDWEEVRPGVFRKVVFLEKLMTVMIEFRNGPWHEKEPFHSHPHEQTSYIAKGEVILYCEGEPDQALSEGDLFYIPVGKKHTIQVMTPMARLVDSFSPIREDFLQ